MRGMKGLELSEKYYEAYGTPMLREQFPGIAGLIAPDAIEGFGAGFIGADPDRQFALHVVGCQGGNGCEHQHRGQQDCQNALEHNSFLLIDSTHCFCYFPLCLQKSQKNTSLIEN